MCVHESMCTHVYNYTNNYVCVRTVQKTILQATYVPSVLHCMVRSSLCEQEEGEVDRVHSTSLFSSPEHVNPP